MLAVLSLAVSCGGGSGSNGSSSTGGRLAEEAAPVDGSNIDGHYQAKFITLNGHVNGTVPGTANFLRKEDKLYAYVRLFAGYPKAWHQQFVYTGSRCPTMNDDTNLDGFIDIAEAEAVVGKILIPMDSDISTQSSGARFYPLADLSGYYAYERITSFSRFLRDLQSPDANEKDDVVKLAPGEGLRIQGKVFMVLGVAETVMLPETVATKERRRPFQTLPVACGVFAKVAIQPGTPYVEGDIGPVASIEPGQDRPAPDDTTSTPTTGGTSGGSTGTNESDDGNGPVSDGNGNTTHTTGGSTVGGTSTGGSTTGGSTTGGSTTGGSSTGSSTGETTGSSSSTSTSSSSTTTTTTTTGGSSTSTSSSTSTGSTAGGFLDSSSGV